VPEVDFFNRLGLFVQRDFLDRKLCSQVLEEASLAEGELALVLPKNSEKILEAQLCYNQRKTDQVYISPTTEQIIRKRILDIKSTLEARFNLKLADIQKPLYYRYRKGDFFAAHQDNSDRVDAPSFLQERRISVIIFLNEMSEQLTPNSYGGGALTFYGLIDNPQWQQYGFNLYGESGMLIAFPSDIYHEVKAVTDGQRYTIVSWFI
jgi:SM-20-related protein